MDDLEPWNMFTNNFVADDPNDLLADADSIINEYNKRPEETDEAVAVMDEMATATSSNEPTTVLSEMNDNGSNCIGPDYCIDASRADSNIMDDDIITMPKIKDEPPDIPDEDMEDMSNMNLNGDDNTIEHSNEANEFLVPEISMNMDHDGNDNGSNLSRCAAGGEDDNTLFNFEETTPIRSTSERIRSSSRLSGGSCSTSNTDASNLDYEYAVLYICPSCGDEFDAQDKWKRHLNGVHEFNTKRGLNFVRIDKLYHECLECHKRIAMHSMENLLKHKYTHLPFRCSKCRFCLRQYKYRQDLMVHLRTQHIHDLIQVTKMHSNSADYDVSNGSGGMLPSKRMSHDFPSPSKANQPNRFEIRAVQEKAFDLFANNLDNVQVKNEILDPDDNDIDSSFVNEQRSSNFVLPAFLEDEMQERVMQQQNVNKGSYNIGTNPSENCEQHIQFICPQCGMEYGNQMQWRQHIETKHEFNTRKGLNFKEINNGQHSMCLECDKILYVNNIPCLQLHKFTHSPRAAWLRCKLCFRTFSGHKDISKHFKQQHSMGMGADLEAAPKLKKPDFRTAKPPSPWSAPSKKYKGDDVSESYDNMPSTDERQPEIVTSETPYFKEVPGDRNEKYIDYLCPACGKDLEVKKEWRDHIVNVHGLTDLKTLNFKTVNDRELKCLECNKIITSAYGIQNAQQHYFTHLPYKAFLRCRVCDKAYGDRKGLVKHLKAKHLNPDGSLKTYWRLKFQQGQSSVTPTQPQQPKNRHNLLAQALQRPISGNGNLHVRETPPPLTPLKRPNQIKLEQPKLKRPRLESAEKPKPAKKIKLKENPYRELVRYSHYYYEIKYIEDEDVKADDDEGGEAEISKSDNSAHNNSDGMPRRERCPDCGSIFRTRSELYSHIKREHDFDDNSKPNNNENDNTDSNLGPGLGADDEDIAIVPMQTQTQRSANSSSSTKEEIYFSFLCPACGIEFRTQVDWRRHINDIHHFDNRHFINFRQVDKFRFQCTTCKDVLSTSKLKTLQDHKFRHLPYKSFLKCKLCGVGYNHKPNIYAHLRIRHHISDPKDPQSQPNSLLDADCKQNTKCLRSTGVPTRNGGGGSPGFAKPSGSRSFEESMNFHNAVDHETITYFCPACNQNFDSHVYWRRHIVEEHNLNSRQGLNFRQIDDHHYLCLQCFKRVTVTHTKGAIGQLQSHKFRHLPYRSFKCLACNGEFVRKQMFFKHLDRTTKLCNGSKAHIADNDELDETDGASSSRSSSIMGSSNKSTKASVHGKSNNESTNADSNDGDLLLEQSFDPTMDLSLDAFLLICPQCGVEFETQRTWREHINIEHQLNRREVLNFKKVNPVLHRCLVCGESVNGRKLRDLQVHCFKHMKFGPYIKCRHCDCRYNYLRNVQDHVKLKHPHVLERIQEAHPVADDDDDDDLSARIVEALHQDVATPQGAEANEEENTVENIVGDDEDSVQNELLEKRDAGNFLGEDEEDDEEQAGIDDGTGEYSNTNENNENDNDGDGDGYGDGDDDNENDNDVDNGNEDSQYNDDGDEEDDDEEQYLLG